MRDIEEVIRKAVVYLGEVQQVENQYRELHAGGGINVFASWALPEKAEALSKEAQEKIEEREKAIEAERRKVADQAQHVHLPVLHGQVYDWWDVIEEAEDTAKRERLRGLADAAIGWIDSLERYLGLSYDTLCADNAPHESSDRSKCHARQEHEKWAWPDEMCDVVSCPEQVLDDLPCKEFAKYRDEQGAWAVNAAFRMAAWLRHWVEEKMTEKVFRYYVYGTAPCSYRLQRSIAVAGNMDDLLTHWQFHNPELSKTLQELYGTLQKAAKNTDRYYKRLSILPYWNEKDFDPREVKKCATQLHDTLLHIASMGLEKLEGTEQTKVGPGQAGGTAMYDQQDTRAFPELRYTNQVPWNNENPAYCTNKSAITDAHKAGADYEIDHLKQLNPDKLNKLLRRTGCTVHFMTHKSPCRGKVHQEEWRLYVRQQVDEHNRFEDAVENEVLNRLDG